MNTLPIHPWPPAHEGTAPEWREGLIAVSTPGGPRAAARKDIRAAICEVAAGLLDIGPERIEVAREPGQPPRLLVDGADTGIGVSISHAEALSVAVLCRAGAVGVDRMQIVLPSNWASMAHDYLGMAAATALAAMPDAQRPQAFCQAWTRREAAFKLRGEQLREWAAGDEGDWSLPHAALGLPDGLIGVAIFSG